MERTMLLSRHAEMAAGTYLQVSRFVVRRIEQQGMIVLHRAIGLTRREHVEMPNPYLEAGRVVL
jgi:hypothetical protein